MSTLTIDLFSRLDGFAGRELAGLLGTEGPELVVLLVVTAGMR